MTPVHKYKRVRDNVNHKYTTIQKCVEQGGCMVVVRDFSLRCTRVRKPQNPEAHKPSSSMALKAPRDTLLIDLSPIYEIWWMVLS